MKIITLNQIQEIIKSLNFIPAIEEGFIAYSQGNAVVPPVGELIFENPPGDVHIKYGYISKDDYYVVKIASGFYENPRLNLPSSNGVMLLFSQKTGELLSILLDEGYLTDLRTAAAGAIAAKYLAPSAVTRIGIVGTGTQAKLQLQYLKNIVDCRIVIVYGRNNIHLSQFKIEMENCGFLVKTAKTIDEVTSTCNLIINANLKNYVHSKLKLGWSPWQIEGRLKLENAGQCIISHETIYRYIYSDYGIRNMFYEKLRRKLINTFLNEI